MNRLDIKDYIEDLDYVGALPLDWSKLAGKTMLISGATGMIGAFLVDALMHKNETGKFRCQVLALGRSESKARERLPYFGRPDFSFEALESEDFFSLFSLFAFESADDADELEAFESLDALDSFEVLELLDALLADSPDDEF